MLNILTVRFCYHDCSIMALTSYSQRMYRKLEDTSTTHLRTLSKVPAETAPIVCNLAMINASHHRAKDRTNSYWYLVDDDEVVNTASRAGSGESSLFSQALGFIKQNQVW